MIPYTLQCELCNSTWLSLCDTPVSVAGPEYEVGTFHFIVHGSHICLRRVPNGWGGILWETE